DAEVPAEFVAEWEFVPLAPHGLAIFFFAAKGQNGEDIFDPGLPARDGSFAHYIHGAVKSYHVSYFANLPLYSSGRTLSNLRKNNHFFLLSQGPIAVTAAGADAKSFPGSSMSPVNSQGFYRMTVCRKDQRIQVWCNDRICIDFTDDQLERYGPPLGAGKIAFRQMSPTIAAYRNLRIWDVVKQK
ncbi:MAG TPA: hypothetical protein DCY35_04720, partial [Prolixibacteraceae bacterium]|nr:hypothetical protein [Prolixibacteraceae bacterium]